MDEESGHDEEQRAAPRGHAAWKAEKERVAARNADARKAGKQQRKADEQKAADRRRALDRAESAALRKR
jgi:hypothetical protein